MARDGLGANRQEPAFLQAAGLQFTYGFTKYINVQGELSVAKSNEARFDDMSFNNMEGALIRRARIGRVHVGGLLRWGDRYQPTLQGSVGLQMTSYETDFVVGSTRMAGPRLLHQVHNILQFRSGPRCSLWRQPGAWA